MDKPVDLRIRHIETGKILNFRFPTGEKYLEWLTAFTLGKEGYEIQESKVVEVNHVRQETKGTLDRSST